MKPDRVRVTARRRVVVRVGLLALVLASATACIFDQSEYKGGGRVDKGATATTAAPSDTADSATTGPPVSEPDAAATLEAAAGGG